MCHTADGHTQKGRKKHLCYGGNLLEDVFRITLELSRQLEAGEVSLDQQVGLGVGVVEFRPNKLERDAGGELPQEGVLLVADGEVLVLGGRREDFDQSPQFGLVIERHTEQLCVGEEVCEYGER